MNRRNIFRNTSGILVKLGQKGVVVKPSDNEDKAIVERSNGEDDGPYWEEGLGCGGGDEDFPLQPLNKSVKFCKSLPFPVSMVTGTGETLSSSSSKCFKSIVKVGIDEILNF